MLEKKRSAKYLERLEISAYFIARCGWSDTQLSFVSKLTIDLEINFSNQEHCEQFVTLFFFT